MSDQDKHLAREAAKKLLAWADGKTLEWAFGDPNNCDPSRMVVSDVGSERVRIRPIAQAKPPEWPPKPTDAQLRKWGKVIAEDKPRAPLKGETFYAYCGGDDFDIATATVNNDANPLSFGGLRWILKDAPKVELPCPPKPNEAVSNQYGRRRWIAEPLEDVVTPWALDQKHANKVVVRKDGRGWGVVLGCGLHSGAFYIGAWGVIEPSDLLRDWTHDGRPCGEA